MTIARIGPQVVGYCIFKGKKFLLHCCYIVLLFDYVVMIDTFQGCLQQGGRQTILHSPFKIQNYSSMLNVNMPKLHSQVGYADFIFRRNATHCISPIAIIVCVCVCLSVRPSVCRVCGPQENGLR